jgi:hypothetical protein
MDVPYHVLKRTKWQEWGYASADESDYQREKRQAAESKVRGFDHRIAQGTLKQADAVAIVRELLRTSRSPSKRPVYSAWLEKETGNATRD